jgi:glycosyltransferase involved in cell wall biosynthesis
MTDLLTVSMPVYNVNPKIFRRAVDSVLAQDYKNLRLVIINDGGQPLELPKDDRIFHLELDQNRGRYFCDSVVLLSLDSGWFAVHDADDWSDKKMYSTLIKAAKDTGAAYCSFMWHRPGLKPKKMDVKTDVRSYKSIGSWAAGVRTVERMWAAGGVCPHYRVGFDTLNNLLITKTGQYAIVDKGLYHYERREQSLTVAKKTKINSEYREANKKKLVVLYNKAQRDIKRRVDLRNTVYMSSPQETRARAEEYSRELRKLYELAK